MWPGWLNTRDADTTGSFWVVVTNAEDSAINELPLQPEAITSGGETLTTQAIDMRKSNRIVKSYYRCFDSETKAMNGDGPAIKGSKDVRNAWMQEGLANGYKLKPYRVAIDGVEQEGVFLGAMNQTTGGLGG